MTCHPLYYKSFKFGIGAHCILTFKYVPMKDRRHLFQVGVSASLFVNVGQKTHSSHGIISMVKNDEIAIMLAGNVAPKWLNSGVIGLDLLFDEATYDQMLETVHKTVTSKHELMKDSESTYDEGMGNNWLDHITLKHFKQSMQQCVDFYSEEFINLLKKYI